MNWEEKLYHHAVPPPDLVWENILDALNDPPLPIREKLLAVSTNPPPGAWETISRELDNEADSLPRIPPKKIILKPLPSVAAAAVLIFLLWGTFSLFRQAPGPIATNGATLAPSLSQPQNDVLTTRPNPAGVDDKPSLHSAQLAIAGLRSRKLQILSAGLVSQAVFLLPGERENEKHWDYQSQEITPIVGNIDLAEASFPINLAGILRKGNEDFFTIKGPNGELLQISSKFRDVIHLMSPDSADEEISDKLFSESRTWREKFKAWKEKMSQSSFTPQSGNFMDIAELIQLLRDEKNIFYTEYPLF